MALPFWDLGLPTASRFGFALRDVWKHEEIGVFSEGYKARLAPHSCEVFRAN